jgi:hypothetical protein
MTTFDKHWQRRDLEAASTAIGKDRVVRSEHGWAVIHDPEGHNVLLLQAGSN